MTPNDSIIERIRQQSRQLVRELDIIRGGVLCSEFTLSQCHVMFELSLHQTLTLMDLAEHLLIDKSNTSRTVKQLVELQIVKIERAQRDNRQKLFSLTSKGEKALQAVVVRAEEQVQDAIDHLDAEQQETVVEGMRLYAGALRKNRLQAAYEIRPIEKRDNLQTARLIRDILTEFGAVGEGYSIIDPEIDNMSGNYRAKDCAYYVITKNDQVTGCGGIAPLVGADGDTCELRKMFFSSSIRGIGLGRKLLELLLDNARKRGFKKCYLETLDRMWAANKLYQRHGFKALDKPHGQTGHCGCDRWYMLDL
jgi:putative acetyltransferase